MVPTAESTKKDLKSLKFRNNRWFQYSFDLAAYSMCRCLGQNTPTLLRCVAFAPRSSTSHLTASRLPPALAQSSAVDPYKDHSEVGTYTTWIEFDQARMLTQPELHNTQGSTQSSIFRRYILGSALRTYNALLNQQMSDIPCVGPSRLQRNSLVLLVSSY